MVDESDVKSALNGHDRPFTITLAIVLLKVITIWTLRFEKQVNIVCPFLDCIFHLRCRHFHSIQNICGPGGETRKVGESQGTHHHEIATTGSCVVVFQAEPDNGDPTTPWKNVSAKDGLMNSSFEGIHDLGTQWEECVRYVLCCLTRNHWYTISKTA